MKTIPSRRPDFYISSDWAGPPVRHHHGRRPGPAQLRAGDRIGPSGEMMREAVAMREEQRLDEPMFRTLLRIRYG